MGQFFPSACAFILLAALPPPAAAQDAVRPPQAERPTEPNLPLPPAPGEEACPRLPAPRQSAPRNGTQFRQVPRTTRFSWRAVDGAVSYGIEVDCMHCCVQGRWCSDIGMTWHIREGLTATGYVHDFVGAQPGRWRVWAVHSCGGRGRTSGWWTFEYKN